ncbi:hypothetical protein VTI74DRAFT_5648 [Chaetomium olivicolor]
MAKGKAGGGVQNRAIYSRISFLQQAATTLSAIHRSSSIPSLAAAPTVPGHSTLIKSSGNLDNVTVGSASISAPLEGMSRRLATDMRTVSLKTRIRLQPSVKQAICKFCDSVLIDGESCTSTIENRSKGARKPWADMLVRKCHTCGKERRYPVHAARPKRKTERGGAGGGGSLQKQDQKS